MVLPREIYYTHDLGNRKKKSQENIYAYTLNACGEDTKLLKRLSQESETEH